MNKFRVLAWAGVLLNSWALVSTVPTVSSYPLTGIVGLALQLAGIVLCIGLIQKKSSALPKARILLLFSAGWSVVGSILQFLMNPAALSPDVISPDVAPFAVAAAVGLAIFSVVFNLVLWKVWGSDEASRYANA